jgi:hypothetical protein
LKLDYGNSSKIDISQAKGRERKFLDFMHSHIFKNFDRKSSNRPPSLNLLPRLPIKRVRGNGLRVADIPFGKPEKVTCTFISHSWVWIMESLLCDFCPLNFPCHPFLTIPKSGGVALGSTFTWPARLRSVSLRVRKSWRLSRCFLVY